MFDKYYVILDCNSIWIENGMNYGKTQDESHDYTIAYWKGKRPLPSYKDYCQKLLSFMIDVEART